MCIHVPNLIHIILELAILRVCHDGGIIALKVLCVGMSELQFILSHLEDEEMLRKLPGKLFLLSIGLTAVAQFYLSHAFHTFVT